MGFSSENGPTFFGRLSALPKKMVSEIVKNSAMIEKIARDDPRRLVHSCKVGLALTLVSLFYYFQPLYDSFGVSAMWAVMTVVVIFEFTVGATLGKGLNRATATLVAGGLGIGTHHLASLCGKIGEPMLIGSFVFLLAAVATFIRFFPKIKARYDYGFLIFILTFSFIAISGYRGHEIIELAHKRLSTIAIGACVSLLINILIFPVWAGEELHTSIALNMEKLGHFLEGFVAEYFKSIDGEAHAKDFSKSLQGYKSVLNSKSIEENLANFANWEPGHGKFGYNHPWNMYTKLGTLIRQCAYRIDALSVYINHSDVKVQQKFEEQIKEACTLMGLESSKALKKLGKSLRSMKHPSTTVNAHIVSSKAAVKTLNSLLKSNLLWQESDLLQIIPVATVASLLIDIVDCTEQIAACAHDLATLAYFKKDKKSNLPSVKPGQSNAPEGKNEIPEIICPQIVIAIAELKKNQVKLDHVQHSLKS
ncbi:aluminum-activated malate transporter 8-like [Silene latifolia]|uniref:aluminum-activated malate transporter 8-like n=1 Tax=Silene latifolia TaxID=37657 RepID=UPI003D77D41F